MTPPFQPGSLPARAVVYEALAVEVARCGFRIDAALNTPNTRVAAGQLTDLAGVMQRLTVQVRAAARAAEHECLMQAKAASR